ncbi:MAG: hypothetical protein CMA60_00130 [Euryarchaeota archaeon]|nr:hypothetical protein [Euryarchaeota archaeon]
MIELYLGVAGSCAERFFVRLSTEATTISVDLNSVPPDASGNVDTNAGDANSTAVPCGGRAPYSFAWTVTETADDGANGSSCAVLSEGTKTNAQYNTATFRVTVGAQLAGVPPAPVEPPPSFTSAAYRLRCTVTDANSQTATADYIVTIQAV